MPNSKSIAETLSSSNNEAIGQRLGTISKATGRLEGAFRGMAPEDFVPPQPVPQSPEVQAYQDKMEAITPDALAAERRAVIDALNTDYYAGSK